MDGNKKALLIGLVLGDGHLNPNSGVALEIEHGEKQKFYIEYKRQLISDLLNCQLPKIHYDPRGNGEYKISKGHRYFKILYKWVYKNRIKQFTPKILSYLNPQAIAIWWMDDGCHSIERNKKTGAIRSHKFEWAMYIDEQNAQNIIDYFKSKWDIKFYPIYGKKKDGTSIVAKLQCRTREGRKFCDLIRPYIIPGFEYKIMQPGE